ALLQPLGGQRVAAVEKHLQRVGHVVDDEHALIGLRKPALRIVGVGGGRGGRGRRAVAGLPRRKPRLRRLAGRRRGGGARRVLRPRVRRGAREQAGRGEGGGDLQARWDRGREGLWRGASDHGSTGRRRGSAARSAIVAETTLPYAAWVNPSWPRARSRHPA